MSINRKKSINVPTAREIKKCKLKWEENSNDQKMLIEYIGMLYLTKRMDEINKVLEECFVLYKKKKSFAKKCFSFCEHMYSDLDEAMRIKLMDNYLAANKEDLKSVLDFNRIKPKLNKFIKTRIDILGFSLEKNEQDEKNLTEESKEEPLSAEEILIAFAPAKEQAVIDVSYEKFKGEHKEGWKNNKNIIKAIFKIARNMRKFDDAKAQELLNFCLESEPKNGNFIRINNKWNPTQLKSEQEEVVEIEMVNEKEEIIRIVPKDKQIYTREDLTKQSPELGNILSNSELDKIIEETPTKFRQSRSMGSILISISKHLLEDAKKVDESFQIYLLIEKMMFDSELREREINRSNVLKYNILVAQGKFEDAEEWNDDKDLGLEPETQTEQKIEITESLAKQEESDSLFYESVREQDIRYYYKRVDYYINDGQFKHKLGDEVSDVIIRNLKNKIAVDLKYLDFEIRELLLPYFIKAESNAKVVLGIHRNVIGAVIDKSIQRYDDQMKFIIDISKLKEEYEDKVLFQKFILAFRVIRNFMAHGNLNIFALRLNQTKKEDGFDDGFEETISMFDDLGNGELGNILKNAKTKGSNLDLFNLSISEKVLSYDAIENRRLFGIGLMILFMVTPRYNFLRIASEIDHKINIFKTRTVLGSKNKLYESLGLRPDWLEQLSKI